MPLGMTQSGLPVGFQVAAPIHDEAAIFELTARYERETQTTQVFRPPV
jgi:Asp-tRNA(Asn)/Glu-tRNA(Gln) amidotransferase A subunit family amidase